MWHLCALGLVEDYIIYDYLHAATNASVSTLIDDLRESTWLPLPLFFRGWVGEVHGMELFHFNHYYMYRSVAELCLMTGVPLFGYWNISEENMGQVITAFNASLDL